MKKESFFQGILILMISQIFIKILGMVQTLYLTNRQGFGDSGNAIYMGSYQIYALLLAFSSIGIPTAISKLISEKIALGDRKTAHKIFKVSVITFGIIGIIGTGLLFFSAEYLANYWIEIPEAKISLIILSPAVFFVSVSSVFKGYFNGLQKMKATANSQLIEQFLKTIVTIILVEVASFYTLNNTFYMSCMATVATEISILIGFIYLLKIYVNERNSICVINEKNNDTKYSVKRIIKMILIFSIPVSLTAILTSVIKLVDSFTVVKILKPILGEKQAKIKYGILSAKADILATLPLSLNIAFTTAIVPAISSANAIGDKRTIKRRVNLSLLLCLIIGLPCTAGMFVYAKEILILLFPNAPEGSSMVAISSITIIFAILAQTINSILQGYGDVKSPVISLLIGLVVKILSNMTLLKIDGIYENGAAIGTVLSHIISFIYVYIILLKKLDFKFSILKLAIKPILATVIMIIFSKFIFNILNLIISIRFSIIIMIIFSIFIYFFCITFLRIFSAEEIQLFPNGEKIYRMLKKWRIYA